MRKLSTYSLTVTLLLSVSGALAQQKMDDMRSMQPGSKPAATQSAHTAIATVKKVNPKAGTVTLAHEPVKSLNWPAMTMGFKVADNALFEKLVEGKKVEVELTKKGNDYIITSVKQ